MYLSTVTCLLTILICEITSDQYIPNHRINIYDEEAYINNHYNWRLLDKEKCGSSLSNRIIGGSNAGLGQYPWLARLGYSSGNSESIDIVYHSGGSLITECWVLSAAHCVKDLPNSLYLASIRLGEYNTEEDVDCLDSVCADETQDFIPVKVLIHKDYNHPRLKDDISLIKLHAPAKFTRWVQPICMPYGELLKKNYMGTQTEVAGWGVEDITLHSRSTILQTVTLPIIDNGRCANIFRSVIVDESQYCVGGILGLDSCSGDSGGPLMKVDAITSPKYYIIGIVSYGSKKCGNKPIPAVYTKLSAYIHWILDNISPCDCL